MSLSADMRPFRDASMQQIRQQQTLLNSELQQRQQERLLSMSTPDLKRERRAARTNYALSLGFAGFLGLFGLDFLSQSNLALPYADSLGDVHIQIPNVVSIFLGALMFNTSRDFYRNRVPFLQRSWDITNILRDRRHDSRAAKKAAKKK